MALSAKSLSGPGYIILNTLRVFNIIAFIAIITSSVLVIVKTVMVSQFYFFDSISHVITAFISMALILSELNIFRSYFARCWPLLSASHSLVALGVVMVIIGVNMLGNLNKPVLSRSSLGLPFWRLVTGSGILVIIFGFLNVILSYIFRDKARSITARQVRAKGAAVHPILISTQDKECESRTSSTAAPSTKAVTPPPNNPTSIRWPSLFLTTRRDRATLPSYHTSPVPSSHYSERHSSELNVESRTGLKISGPLESDPGFVGSRVLVRPDSAMHPSRKG